MKLHNQLAKALYGRTQDEAQTAGICVRCGEQPEFKDKYGYDEREYNISALCPKCFDAIAADDDGRRLGNGVGDSGLDN